MYQNELNTIQRARNGKGLTQEALAERAGYSADTIRAWESGARVASLEALSKLQIVLDAPWLSGVYLQEQSDVLQALLPEFKVGKPLAQAAAGYITCVLDLIDNRVDRKLLQLVADGKIDEVEQPIYDEILRMAEQANKAYYEMRFAQG